MSHIYILYYIISYYIIYIKYNIYILYIYYNIYIEKLYYNMYVNIRGKYVLKFRPTSAFGLWLVMQ